MTVYELVTALQRAIRAGRISEDADVNLRNPLISEEAMEAGSNGYADLDEVLIGDDEVFLLGDFEEV